MNPVTIAAAITLPALIGLSASLNAQSSQRPANPCPSIVVAPDLQTPIRDTLEVLLAARGFPIVQRGDDFRTETADNVAQGRSARRAACWMWFAVVPTGSRQEAQLRLFDTETGEIYLEATVAVSDEDSIGASVLSELVALLAREPGKD